MIDEDENPAPPATEATQPVAAAPAPEQAEAPPPENPPGQETASNGAADEPAAPAETAPAEDAVEDVAESADVTNQRKREDQAAANKYLTQYALDKWAELRNLHKYLKPDEMKNTVISELETYAAEQEVPLDGVDIPTIAEKTRTTDQNAE